MKDIVIVRQPPNDTNLAREARPARGRPTAAQAWLTPTTSARLWSCVGALLGPGLVGILSIGIFALGVARLLALFEIVLPRSQTDLCLVSTATRQRWHCRADGHSNGHVVGTR